MTKAADQVVTRNTAHQLYAEAMRRQAKAGWIVMKEQPAYPGKLVARLATTELTPYVLLADTIMQLREALPRGLNYSERQLTDPEGVVEIWLSPSDEPRSE